MSSAVCMLKNDSVLVYNPNRKVSEKRLEQAKKNFLKKDRSKTFSRNEVRRLKKVVDNFSVVSSRSGKEKSFWTFTLTDKQIHSDKEIKRVFTTAVNYLMRKYEHTTYFYVAETQKNGNIHFHLLLDGCMPIKYVNSYWLKCLEKKGYKTRSSDGSSILNPVDVESVKGGENSVKQVRNYLMGYLIDNDISVNGLKAKPKNSRVLECDKIGNSSNIAQGRFRDCKVPMTKLIQDEINELIGSGKIVADKVMYLTSDGFVKGYQEMQTDVILTMYNIDLESLNTNYLIGNTYKKYLRDSMYLC